MPTLFWHRRDLRVADNVGLAAASDPVIPVFVLDDDVLEHAGPSRVAFLADALESLRADYRTRDGDLLVVRGDPATELPRLAADYGADTVRWNRDYSGLAAERDEGVRAALTECDVTVTDDALLHVPGSITTNAGDHYSVFSYFWDKWRDRPKDEPCAPPASVVDVSSDGVPALDADPEADVPPAGTDAARDLLADFCAADVYDYAEARDYPAREGTSRLSPHLHFGTIGVREVYDATEDAKADADDEDAAESVTEYQRQLAWREFYAHALAARPDVVTANYREYENDIEWRDDPDELAAWKRGETGYPLVDAGMRQLRAEAYMHNRVRMVVASFLTKDLLVDWREGYRWFRRRLVDHDPANDAGGWQWAAGTGADAQPYFRVFNPATQCERFDPEGEYVREYVPELRGVDADAIHDWPTLDPAERERLAPEYSAPIVDHSERREEAIAMFERARGED
ncbi:MAG: deoxyribodipyrimidine photo-lyase [Halobacteriaceae archaeon]